MWRSFGSHAFVATPWGHGIDTHRLWEVLALGSVPVVISSPLDSVLYADFPVVTIGSWAEANASAMLSWRAQISRRFGAEPFGELVRTKLTSAYWAGQIAAQHRRPKRLSVTATSSRCSMSATWRSDVSLRSARLSWMSTGVDVGCHCWRLLGRQSSRGTAGAHVARVRPRLWGGFERLSCTRCGVSVAIGRARTTPAARMLSRDDANEQSLVLAAECSPNAPDPPARRPRALERGRAAT
jgi:hypothetical protein